MYVSETTRNLVDGGTHKFAVLPGRFCQEIPQLLNLTCCLPCPMTALAYPDGMRSPLQPDTL
jgi:hypothetical protein